MTGLASMWASADAQPRRRETMALETGTYGAFLRAMGLEVGEGQRRVVAVCYDGDQPEPTALDRQLFGAAEQFTAQHSGVVNITAGGRGGKSYILIALRMLWGMLVRDVSSAAPGQSPVALVVARNEKLRGEVVRYAIGAVRAHPWLEAMLVHATTTGFALRRPDGALVAFEAGVATPGGYGARGRSLTDFALDEIAFVGADGAAVSDVDLFAAGAPRVLPGGQTILASTPWAEAGLLYENHVANYGRPVSCIAVHAPTLTLRDTAFTRQIVERERARDEDNYRREFLAEFQTTGTSQMFSATLLEAHCDRDWTEGDKPKPGERVTAGADFAFVSDSSALAIVADDGKKIRTTSLTELRPKPGEPLKPSVTVRTFAAQMVGHTCRHLVADGHYREAIIEHLAEERLAFYAAPTVPSEAYVRVKQLLNEGRVTVPNHPRLLQQLREVQAVPTAAGRLQIILPRSKGGGHSDLVSAWVLAVFQISGTTVPLPPPAVGTAAWEAKLRLDRMDRVRQAKEQPFWKR